tara:strand:+ start:166 stop:546 length:381 start_codon:yes stop_codon:yes gene_type:complete
MGLLSSMMGNASSADVEKVTKQIEPFLLDDEKIESAYKIFRDMIIFTERRMITVDVQGFTGKKKDFRSIPYKHIQQFSVETSGTFDMDAELKIWTSAEKDPIEFQFKKGDSIYDVQKSLVLHSTHQ